MGLRSGLAAMAFGALALMASAAQAQTANDLLKALTKGATPAPTVSQRDASDGLRSALDLSAKAVTERLGRADGFFGDARIRIPLPGALGRAQRSLKPMGLAGPLDDLQLTMNRSAESAMPTARRLFLDAIRGLTFDDALTILRGGDDAATQFLRRRTEASLIQLLRPPMQQALTRSGAYAALDQAVRRTPAAQFLSVSRDDLTNFAVQKTLDGAFSYIAEEERTIRSDPAKQTTNLLRKVFGGR